MANRCEEKVNLAPASECTWQKRILHFFTIAGPGCMAILTAINWAAKERRNKMSAKAGDREDEGTIYVAYWSHTPENCPGRSKEGAKMLRDFWTRRDKFARKGIKILGGYVTVTGHAYYILLQAKDFATATEFFLPIVPTQTGTFIPVLTMDEWIMMNQPK